MTVLGIFWRHPWESKDASLGLLTTDFTIHYSLSSILSTTFVSFRFVHFPLPDLNYFLVLYQNQPSLSRCHLWHSPLLTALQASFEKPPSLLQPCSTPSKISSSRTFSLPQKAASKPLCRPPQKLPFYYLRRFCSLRPSALASTRETLT